MAVTTASPGIPRAAPTQQTVFKAFAVVKEDGKTITDQDFALGLVFFPGFFRAACACNFDATLQLFYVLVTAHAFHLFFSKKFLDAATQFIRTHKGRAQPAGQFQPFADADRRDFVECVFAPAHGGRFQLGKALHLLRDQVIQFSERADPVDQPHAQGFRRQGCVIRARSRAWRSPRRLSKGGAG